MKKRLLVAPFLAAVVLLTGCTASTESTTAGPTSVSTTEAAPSSDSAVTVTDPWVKATEDSMTAAFAQLTNNSDQDLHAVSATTDQSNRTELHEMISQGGETVMSEMPDGFTIPAGGTFTLEPGADHIMMMELASPIEAGQDVEITLEFSDGSSITWTAPARVYDGANESYDDDMSSQSEDTEN